MNIVIASDLYFPVVNGVSVFTRNLSYGLAKKGHTVTIICPSTTLHSHTEHQADVVIKRVSSIPFRLYPVRVSILPIREIKKIIDEVKPDIIHTQSVLGIARALVIQAKKHNIPLIMTHHAMPENVTENIKILSPIRVPFKQIMQSYESYLSGHAAHITTPTKTAAEILLLNKPKNNLSIVSNGVDTDLFNPGIASRALKKQLKLPNKPLVLSVGRVDGEKHLIVLIRAMKLLLKETEAHCLIVGRGNALANMKRQVVNLGIQNNISFAGFVADNLLPDIYRLGSVFAITSPTELQSITTLEALATGLPVVVADSGALPELCHSGINGLQFKTDDPRSLADSLIAIINDKSKIKEMGLKSRNIALENSLYKTIDIFESIYKKEIKTYKNRHSLS